MDNSVDKNKKTQFNPVDKFLITERKRNIIERDRELIRDYLDNGFPIKELEEKYNISRQRIYQILVEQNIPRSKKQSRYQELRRKVLVCYQENCFPYDIAEKLNVSRSFVCRVLREHKLPLQRMRRETLGKLKTIATMRKQGYTQAQIAKELEVGQNAVSALEIRYLGSRQRKKISPLLRAWKGGGQNL